MKGFPCKLIVEASEGASAGDKGKIASVITTISVLLIVKRDGLHVLKSNAVGERRQVGECTQVLAYTALSLSFERKNIDM